MDSVMETFQKYMGSGLIMILFLLALAYLFVYETRKPRRILFIYTPVLILLLFFNPLFAGLFHRIADEETYFRFCWTLPYLTVLGYTALSIVSRQKGKRAVLAYAAAAALLMASGKLVYLNPLYSLAENQYHVPDSVVHICDAIEVPGREVRAVFPEELLLYVRQYSPVVFMPYGREVLMGEYNEMHEIMESAEIDIERLLRLTRAQDCPFLVFRQDAVFSEDPDTQELELLCETDGYMVYQDKAMPLFIPEMSE